MKHHIRTVLALAALCACAAAAAAGPEPVYEPLDPLACTKPLKRPPPLPKESYEAYNIERRFLDLDGSGQCVLMDIWIARLGGSASVGMRTLEQRFLRFSAGKWRAFSADLAYFPRALRAHPGNTLILVDAPTEQDTGDAMLVPTDTPRVFAVAGWTDGGTRLDLRPADEQGGAVLRALEGAPGRRPDVRLMQRR
ncbi:hypothetical protein LXA47_07090 [Massilia sp. P8910]|uniref:hypothetical protein n=1 Tax=Massilia antarctica TaxID=2765360 RepID=UPI001E2C5FED|nr:hypothetical protein [Massilia antarctica]MCE3603373.1 hypothetical protein [Massilia antarctica]